MKVTVLGFMTQASAHTTLPEIKYYQSGAEPENLSFGGVGGGPPLPLPSSAHVINLPLHINNKWSLVEFLHSTFCAVC